MTGTDTAARRHQVPRAAAPDRAASRERPPSPVRPASAAGYDLVGAIIRAAPRAAELYTPPDPPRETPRPAG